MGSDCIGFDHAFGDQHFGDQANERLGDREEHVRRLAAHAVGVIFEPDRAPVQTSIASTWLWPRKSDQLISSPSARRSGSRKGRAALRPEGGLPGRLTTSATGRKLARFWNAQTEWGWVRQLARVTPAFIMRSADSGR
jgi:hypothetical protein